MKRKMTKKEALAEFKSLYPPILRFNGKVDKVAMAEEWSNYTDSLCEDGRITLEQHESWDNPY